MRQHAKMDSKGGSWQQSGGLLQPPWLSRRKASPGPPLLLCNRWLKSFLRISLSDYKASEASLIIYSTIVESKHGSVRQTVENCISQAKRREMQDANEVRRLYLENWTLWIMMQLWEGNSKGNFGDVWYEKCHRVKIQFLLNKVSWIEPA